MPHLGKSDGKMLFFFNLNSGILEFRITFRSSTDFLSGEF